MPGVPKDAHLIANAALMLLATVWHLLCVGSVALNVTVLAVGSPLLGPPPGSDAELAGQLIAFVWMAIAALVGVIWAPVNAYGLFKRRPWARKSTMGYWLFVGVLCCCVPGTIYGLVSLNRQQVRRELGEEL